MAQLHNDTKPARDMSSDPDIKSIVSQTDHQDDHSDQEAAASQPFYTRKSRRAAYFTTIFSGAALFSDGYQSGIISFVQVVLKMIYGTDVFDADMASRISYSMFVGAVVGQLGFGIICDRIGRKIGLVCTTLLVIVGAAMCAASSGVTPTGLLWMLVVSRGIMGVGVGGEYPCSSVAAGESADEVLPNRRGLLFIMVTNFMIDFGYVISALVPIILLAIFGEGHLEPVWRLSLGLGIIPPLSVLYFRLHMSDPARYRKSHMKRRVPYWLIFKRYWRRILTTGGLWFIYDFISYPAGVFSSTILSVVVPPGSPLIQTAGWNTLLYTFYLPGVIAGAFLADKIGRRKTMTAGFIAQGIVGMIMGGCLNLLVKNCFPMFVIMYGIFLMMGELGPGNTIGLVSTEVYPTAVRGTAYGISAAIGKVGATVGTLAFEPMISKVGVQGPFLLESGIAILAGILAFFFIPNVQPDSLEQEDRDFKAYLEEHGYDTALMGDPVDVPVVDHEVSPADGHAPEGVPVENK